MNEKKVKIHSNDRISRTLIKCLRDKVPQSKDIAFQSLNPLSGNLNSIVSEKELVKGKILPKKGKKKRYMVRIYINKALGKVILDFTYQFNINGRLFIQSTICIYENDQIIKIVQDFRVELAKILNYKNLSSDNVMIWYNDIKVESDQTLIDLLEKAKSEKKETFVIKIIGNQDKVAFTLHRTKHIIRLID